MDATLLVVDDTEDVRKYLKRFLEREGFAVLVADNASEAVLLAEESRPHLIITDIEMPGLDGRAFCRILKKKPATAAIPVIMMSGVEIKEEAQLKGYESGAVDYITKPISGPILLAKIRALLKQSATKAPLEGTLKGAGVVLSPSARTAHVGKKAVDLTPREFDLLAALLESPGRVLSVNHLLQTVWRVDPAEYNDPRSVEVHISRLRKKLGPAFAKHLVNVTGHGYKFEP